MKHKNIKGKRVLITGVTGFIGRHLAKELSTLEAIVYGISQSTETKNIIKGNIMHYDFLNEVVQKKKIQVFIHLAGESLVEAGQDAPFKTFKTNIQGTLNALEVSRANRLEKIIIASTSHVYGKNKLPYYEGYTPKPSRPYETSKATTDLLAQSYADTFRLPVLIPRFVNIYGPGDLNFNRVIPKFLKGIYQDGKITMWGGEARRDYLYINDAVSAYVHMAKLSISEIIKNRIFNFGSGNVLSVNEVLEKIKFQVKKPVKIEKIQSDRELEIRAQYVSFKKAEKILGWRPKTEIDTGLRKTIRWYEEYFKDK